MELVCLLLTVFGLIVCFGGIYIRKLCSSLMGLVWGAFLSVIIVILTADSIWRIDFESNLIWIAVGAIVFAMFSVIYEKICVFLNSFIPTFFIICILMMSNTISEHGLQMSAVAMIALVVAFVVGYICCKIHDIAFMLETAFTGAFIASLGIYGLAEKPNSIANVLFGAIMNEEASGHIFLGTIVLGIIGFCVQRSRLKAVKVSRQGAFFSEKWQCECGKLNPYEYQFCENCGNQCNHTHDLKKSWVCKCGAINAEEMQFCSECGESRLQQEYSKWICSTCGTENEHDMLYCSECGKASGGKNNDY